MVMPSLSSVFFRARVPSTFVSRCLSTPDCVSPNVKLLIQYVIYHLLQDSKTSPLARVHQHAKAHFSVPSKGGVVIQDDYQVMTHQAILSTIGLSTLLGIVRRILLSSTFLDSLTTGNQKLHGVSYLVSPYPQPNVNMAASASTLATLPQQRPPIVSAVPCTSCHALPTQQCKSIGNASSRPFTSRVFPLTYM